MLVGDILRAAARNRNGTVGLVHSGRAHTYGELNARANRLANALVDAGLARGARVALLLPNGAQFVECFFGCLMAGVVVVPVNILLSAPEAAAVIRDAGACACVYSTATAALARATRPLAPALELAISTEADGDARDYETLLEKASVGEPHVDIAPDDLAMIMYTSGSTGAAKGVMSTHRNIVANAGTMCLELRIAPEDVTLVVMPMFHNGGLWPLLTHFYRGGKVVVHQRFVEADALAAVTAHRVSVLNLVPTTMARFIAHPAFASTDLSSLRLVMHGGGPITLDALTQAMRALGPQRVFTSLGSTEANGMLTAFSTLEHALDGPLVEKLASVGREATNVELRIVDEQGREKPVGEVGEIIARGENISPGYWNNAEETASTFRDGWLHVGDLAYRDRDGFIFIAGRKKDIIISGGENVSALEVEQALERHPEVASAAVFGVPDDKWGEAVFALVNLKPGAHGVDEAALIAYCGESLAPFKRPKKVRFTGEFPRTALGKVAKGELRRLFIESLRS